MTASVTIHKCSNWQHSLSAHSINECFVDFSNYSNFKHSSITIPHPSIGTREAYSFMNFLQGGLAVQKCVQDLLFLIGQNPAIFRINIYVDGKIDDTLLNFMLRTTFHAGGVFYCSCDISALPPLPISPVSLHEQISTNIGLLGLGEPLDFKLFDDTVFSAVSNVIGPLSDKDRNLSFPPNEVFSYDSFDLSVPEDISVIWKGGNQEQSNDFILQNEVSDDLEEDFDVENILSQNGDKKKRRYRGKRGGGKRK
jgi:hypothetical protein